jgi:hypothetical protein
MKQDFIRTGGRGGLSFCRARIDKNGPPFSFRGLSPSEGCSASPRTAPPAVTLRPSGEISETFFYQGAARTVGFAFRAEHATLAKRVTLFFRVGSFDHVFLLEKGIMAREPALRKFITRGGEDFRGKTCTQLR